MFNHELYASAFARAVDLMAQQPPNRDQQKAALRALVALAELSAASLRLYEGILSIDDVPIPDNMAHLPALIARMQKHGLAELMVGRQSEPAELLALLRGLAAEPGDGPGIKERLREAQSKRIMVILEQAAPPPNRQRSVTQAFEAHEIEMAALEMDRRAATPELSRTQAPKDDILAAWNAMHGDSSEIPVAEEAPAARGPQPTEETPEPPSPVPVAQAPADPLEAALSAVVLDPYGMHLLDRLTYLSTQIAEAMREDRAEPALRALAIIMDLEPGAPEGTARNSYGIVLKRTLTRDILAQIAQCLLNPSLIDAGGKAMRRAKGEGAEVLLGLLATAEGLRERRAFMTVLRTIPDATDRVIAMLNHHQWFVVRNIAELLGELRVEDSVPDLGRVLTHHDQRVRRAAAIALAKIGSVGTVEPLRKQLKEGAPDVRSAIAASIGGTHARALAMPLVALADAESNADVLREYYRALGRIGTPDAIQGLVNAAAPGGKLLKRKPTANRLAAVDGLRLAKAESALNSLADDSDKAVKEAVQAALKELRK
jgi:HEAT repeat protein